MKPRRPRPPSRQAYEELEEAYRKERDRTRADEDGWPSGSASTAAALLVLLVRQLSRVVVCAEVRIGPVSRSQAICGVAIVILDYLGEQVRGGT